MVLPNKNDQSSAQPKSSTSGSARTLREKLAIAAGAGAVAACVVGAPGNAHADLVMSTTVGGGISPPTAGFSGSFWDVDNDGTNDFRLFHGTIQDLSYNIFRNAFLLDLNGGWVVNPVGASPVSPKVAKMAMGETIGSTLGLAYKLNANPGYQGVTYDGNIAGGGWTIGDTGFFGFSFTNTNGTHYGWAEMTVSGTPVGSGFTINEAYYETTPGASVQAGVTAVPEASQVASLSLLALGAAGVALWRSRRTDVAVLSS